MKISKDHFEWAAIYRMGNMLEEEQPEYDVTHAYALFVPILCWVVQRVRCGGSSDTDLRARALQAELERESITSPPWLISSPSLVGFDAMRVLVALRNAVAHGDARRVAPVNLGSRLIGYEFSCEESDRNRNVAWKGKVTLTGKEMRRIGVHLATRFRQSLHSSQASEEPDPFELEVRQISEATE